MEVNARFNKAVKKRGIPANTQLQRLRRNTYSGFGPDVPSAFLGVGQLEKNCTTMQAVMWRQTRSA